MPPRSVSSCWIPGAISTASLTVAGDLRLWARGRAGARLLGEELLQLLQVGLHLGLVHTVEGVIAGHQRCLGSRVVGDDLGVERDDLLLQRPGRAGRRCGPRAGRSAW